MPAKKMAPAKEPAKETASAKSEAPPKFIDAKVKFEEIFERLEKLETTVDAIRREYKGKGIPMP